MLLRMAQRVHGGNTTECYEMKGEHVRKKVSTEEKNLKDDFKMLFIR